jgi:hypothetical protein
LDRVIQYDVALKSDAYLLLFRGSRDTARRVEMMLANSGHEWLDAHGAGIFVLHARAFLLLLGMLDKRCSGDLIAEKAP